MRCFGEYDICVIGAGHAGCEAASAAARLGARTVCFAVTLDGIANMACNPSIGGTAKGQLVREIDALGGIMGRIADKTAIQVKMLNKGKGPAVYSPRAQIDRIKYRMQMKHELEMTDNLDIKQGEVVRIVTERDENNGGRQRICGVVTNTGAFYACRSVIACTGTYLRGRIIMGELAYSGGPDGQFPANELSNSLRELGLTLVRLKTGTPPRVNGRSIDYSKTEIQPGDERYFTFSFDTADNLADSSNRETPPEAMHESKPCFLTHTNLSTHDIIRANLDRSPLYNGIIEGVGPRYCPSIEDKITRFADKDAHPVFLEPMGSDTEEVYLQGLSSSLPEDVQLAFVHSVQGLENASVMRPAYAIEYDAIDARCLRLSLECRDIDGLFCAGQINGSSGYEEAAAQGLMAGINAARRLKGEEPLIIDRSEGYIGVLIDDLVTRGTKEPYRMMTSRAEYRLLLRQDNADERLTPKGYEIGLISEERYRRFTGKMQRIERELSRLRGIFLPPDENINAFLCDCGGTPLQGSISAYDLIKRPEISIDKLYRYMIDNKIISTENNMLPLNDVEREQTEIIIKYEGYIKRENVQVEQFRKNERRRLPDDLDYEKVPNISREAREKLSRIHPESVGQASRITGVSPADIASLLVYMRAYRANTNRSQGEEQE